MGTLRKTFLAASLLILAGCGQPFAPQAGPASADVVCDDGAEVDFGLLGIGNSQDVLIRMKNRGLQDATAITSTFSAGQFSYVGGSYPGVGGDCGTTLLAGDQCSVMVRFAPTLSVESTQVLPFRYFDGTKNRSVQQPLLHGEGM